MRLSGLASIICAVLVLISCPSRKNHSQPAPDKGNAASSAQTLDISAEYVWNPSVHARFTKEEVLVPSGAINWRIPTAISTNENCIYVCDSGERNLYVFDIDNGDRKNIINISKNPSNSVFDFTLHDNKIYITGQFRILTYTEGKVTQRSNSKRWGTISVYDDSICGIQYDAPKGVVLNVCDINFANINTYFLRQVYRFEYIAPLSHVFDVVKVDNAIVVNQRFENKLYYYELIGGQLVYRKTEKWVDDPALDSREANNKENWEQELIKMRSVQRNPNLASLASPRPKGKFLSIASRVLALDGALWGLIPTYTSSGVLVKIQDDERELIGFDVSEGTYPCDFALRKTDAGLELIVLFGIIGEKGKSRFIKKFSGLVDVDDASEKENKNDVHNVD